MDQIFEEGPTLWRMHLDMLILIHQCLLSFLEVSNGHVDWTRNS